MPHNPPVTRCCGREKGQIHHDPDDWDRWLLAWRGPAYSIWFTARWAREFEARLGSGLLTDEYEQFEGCKTLEDIAKSCHDHFIDCMPDADPLLFDGGIMALENGLTPETAEKLDSIRWRQRKEARQRDAQRKRAGMI